MADLKTAMLAKDEGALREFFLRFRPELLLAARIVFGFHFSTGAPTRLPHSVHEPS